LMLVVAVAVAAVTVRQDHRPVAAMGEVVVAAPVAAMQSESAAARIATREEGALRARAQRSSARSLQHLASSR
jgi:hypothetical protein